MLQNAYLLAKIGFDTAENGPHRFQKSAELDTALKADFSTQLSLIGEGIFSELSNTRALAMEGQFCFLDGLQNIETPTT